MKLPELNQDVLISAGINIAIIAAAVMAALCVHAVLIRLFRRIGGWMPPELNTALLARTKRPIRITLVLIALQIALLYLPLDAVHLGHVELFLRILVIGALGWVTCAVVLALSDWLKHKYEWESLAAENLKNRRISTQLAVFTKIAILVVGAITLLGIVMAVPGLRNLGLSLFASAGVAGLVIGMAAKSTLSNLLAGVQMAVSQPIRLDDSVTVQGLNGTIEEIGSSFVVVKLTDWRRLIVPLNYFMEQPFQNWTYTSTELLGNVMFYLDYSAPVDAIRKEMERITDASTLWDHNKRQLQVTDCREMVMEITIQVSAANSATLGDLKAEIREKLLAFLSQLNPTPLPRQRSQAIDAPVVEE